jgi:hypothetical protein
MTRSTDEREKQIAELKKVVTKRGFDRHASVLKSTSKLPAEFQSHAVEEATAREVIKTIILFPPQIQRGWRYVPTQALLFTSTDAIHLLASIWPDQEPQLTFIKGCSLMYMKVKLLLLYGFLEIVAHGKDSTTRLGMEFNTVAWPRMSLPFRQLLQKSITSPAAPIREDGSSLVMQQALEDLPLKFSNGVKIYGLLPGEQLQELVFQPEVSERWLFLFRRQIMANTLLLLTNNYVMVIQEELRVSQGWILSYIPRECIIEMQNQPRGLCNDLVVQLKRGDQTVEYRLLLEAEAVEAWHTRWIQHGGQWRDLAEEVGEKLVA